jgi:hypothetical protein
LVTYNIYRNGKQVASDIEEKEYTDTGLESDTTYEYQVSAVNEYGESELSDELVVKTKATTTTTTTTTTTAAPTTTTTTTSSED